MRVQSGAILAVVCLVVGFVAGIKTAGVMAAHGNVTVLEKSDRMPVPVGLCREP